MDVCNHCRLRHLLWTSPSSFPLISIVRLTLLISIVEKCEPTKKTETLRELGDTFWFWPICHLPLVAKYLLIERHFFLLYSALSDFEWDNGRCVWVVFIVMIKNVGSWETSIFPYHLHFLFLEWSFFDDCQFGWLDDIYKLKWWFLIIFWSRQKEQSFH